MANATPYFTVNLVPVLTPRGIVTATPHLTLAQRRAIVYAWRNGYGHKPTTAFTLARYLFMRNRRAGYHTARLTVQGLVASGALVPA